MNQNLQDLYDIAKKHKDEHREGKKRCGGEPYKSFEKLFQVVEDFAKDFRTDNPSQEIKVLEIGTAVGFTTFVLQQAIQSPRIQSPRQARGCIDTIEHHQVHVDEAKKNISDWGGDVSKINFYIGEAENILPTLAANSYNIIFFDGYGVKEYFYEDFERLTKDSGVLILANKFLKTTEQKIFQTIVESGKWGKVEEFADTIIFKKKSQKRIL